MYTYGLFMLIFDRKQNSVKQLSFNKKINRKKAIFRAFLLKLSVVTNVPNIYGDRNAFESFYLRLGLEPTWLGLESIPNPHGWDLNPAKTHSTWFQDPVKCKFLMSHHRKNSVRDSDR